VEEKGDLTPLLTSNRASFDRITEAARLRLEK